jgi:hypothetical protein
MKTESLHALVIDQYAGELPPDVADLLEAYLATNASAREEASRTLSALEITGQAVKQHPELGRCAVPVVLPRVKKKMVPAWLKAAAVLTFAALTAAGGFYSGRARLGEGQTSFSIATAQPIKVRKDSPWARYRMAIDPSGGGMQVVRVDVPKREARP